MEGVPYFPESSPEEDDDDSFETKDKKDSREKKRPLFEKPAEAEDDKKKKSFEFFSDDKPEKRDDKEPPVDTLADEEKQMVAAEVVKDRQQDVRQELAAAEDDSAEEQEALVGATFLEALEQEVESGTPVEEALEIAEDQAAEVADIELEPAETEAPAEEDTEAEEEDEDPAAAVATSSSSGSASTPTPPIPPTPPSQSTPPPTPPIPPIGGGGAGHMPGASPAPLPAVRRRRTQEVVVVPDRRRERANLLVGGLVGYFIGRRRGRIKTEKKLLPVQEKLENQVNDLTSQVLEREHKLRQAARTRYERDPQSARKTIERMQELQELKAVERRRTIKKPEQIGKFAVLAERPAQTPENPKPVELMTVPELLDIAAVIKIERGSLKQLHEAHHLNDEGLRRVVRAYLRGERYEPIIRENIQSPEIYRQPVEQSGHHSAQTVSGDILQKLTSSGSSSYFALPSLNQTPGQEPGSNSGFQPKSHKSRAPLMAGGALVGVALATLLLLM